jgi:hypothetical protein
MVASIPGTAYITRTWYSSLHDLLLVRDGADVQCSQNLIAARASRQLN